MNDGTIIPIAISGIGVLLAGYSFFFTRKNEAVKIAERNASNVTMLQERVSHLQKISNNNTIAEISQIKQSLSDLKERVTKLDVDVEKKIDLLNDKMDKILIHILKKSD